MSTNQLKLTQAYEGKRVFITGHSGFKGSWLTFFLKQLGAQVHGYSLVTNTFPSLFDAAGIEKDCTTTWGNILDDVPLTRCIKEFEPHIIFHLAAQPIVSLSYKEPRNTINVNVIGTVNVLDAVRELNKPVAVVCITSDKCYENKEWTWGYRENEPMGGYDPYSASKGMAELVISSYRRSFLNQSGIYLASARAGNVIGGGDWARDRIIPDIMCSLAKSETPIIRNPDAVRPWQHVLDPLYGYLWLGQKLLEGNRIFCDGWNFGPAPEDAKTVSDLFSTIAGYWGFSPSAGYSTSTTNFHEAKYLMLSIEKALRAGWSPQWNFSTAVRETTKWYKAYYSQAGQDQIRSIMSEQIRAFIWKS